MVGIIDYYRSEIWQDAGSTNADRQGMNEPYKGGLLHLVYYFVYTSGGRNWLHFRTPNKNGYTEATVRSELTSLMNDYRISGQIQQAVIGAHLAGSAWVQANEAGDAVERDKQEAIFKQHTSAISWFLWEEGSGPLFPLFW